MAASGAEADFVFVVLDYRRLYLGGPKLHFDRRISRSRQKISAALLRTAAQRVIGRLARASRAVRRS
jgi:hypothetical protein